MPGMWKKTMQYLGLVEDEDLDELDVSETTAQRPERRQRRYERAEDTVTPDRQPETIVRTMPAVQRPPLAAIHRAGPKRFNEAREIGERFREGVPVIMNLQGADDAVARRMVDFAAGLVFGLEGKLEQVASRVYLLTPAHMEVSAEEREKIVEGGFYNQF